MEEKMKAAVKIVVLCFLALIVSCKEKGPTQADLYEIKMRENAQKVSDYAWKLRTQKKEAYNDFINSLSLEEKISQLFIVNLAGNQTFIPVEQLDDSNFQNKALIPGGYLFFGFNLAETPKEIMGFTSSINSYCIDNSKIPPFLAIDHEGGVVNRLKSINAKLISCQEVAEKLSTQEAYKLYELQANQLYELGFTMNLAPVTEACTKDNKDFLGDRSFGSLENVIKYSKECINSYQKNKIAAIVKHFPGNTNTDPHTGLPLIKAEGEKLEELLAPFKALIAEAPVGILMSHAIVDSVDKGVPSCLSKIWVTKILREEYGYNGIIFSDDIFMAALAKNGYPEEKAVVLALEAGIDCIMVSEKRIIKSVRILEKKAQEDKAFEERINESLKRIIDYKLKCGLLEYQKTGDGKLKISGKKMTESLDERLKNFNTAKEENQDFNKEHL